jgi:hypothetical protein
MIKIYVIMAIVEVFDRLMCSLEQSCLDMYWNSVSRPRSSRMLINVLVVARVFDDSRRHFVRAWKH